MNQVTHYYLDVVNGERNDIVARIVRVFLCLLSGIYFCANGVVKTLRTAQQKKLAKPVISIGNVTWGGTGKTPLVQLLLAFFKHNNISAAVLMRGYGADENTMLSDAHPDVPIVSGKNRGKEAAAFLRDNTVDLFLLDDGFQHWPLARDYDIVTINCLNPWGSGALIPGGPLREPLSALRRADAVILTNANAVTRQRLDGVRQKILEVCPDVLLCQAAHVARGLFKSTDEEVLVACDSLAGKDVLIFSGIGTPASFRATIETCGVRVREEIIYPDHYAFTDGDIEQIKKKADALGVAACITTEKDFMRNQALVQKGLDPFVLKIEMEITENYETLCDRLGRLLPH